MFNFFIPLQTSPILFSYKQHHPRASNQNLHRPFFQVLHAYILEYKIQKFQKCSLFFYSDLPVLQVKNIIVLFLSGISASARERTISPLSSFSGSPQAGTGYQVLNQNKERREIGYLLSHLPLDCE